MTIHDITTKTINRAALRSLYISLFSRRPEFAYAIRLTARLSNIRARRQGLLGQLRYHRLLPGANIVGRVRLSGTGKFSIGAGFSITSIETPSIIDCAQGGILSIGENAAANYGVIISARKRVIIGKNAMIGNMVIISDTICPMFDDAPIHRGEIPDPITIGDNVWLAARVTVLPGANIGNGAVIGAGSIVNGRIPDNVFAIGNPARPLVKYSTKATNLRSREDTFGL